MPGITTNSEYTFVSRPSSVATFFARMPVVTMSSRSTPSMNWMSQFVAVNFMPVSDNPAHTSLGKSPNGLGVGHAVLELEILPVEVDPMLRPELFSPR